MATMKRVFIIAFLFLVPALAKADEMTYTYTGPAPADLSGSFTTPAILAPNSNLSGLSNAFFIGVTSFSFTDGVDTWTPANSTFGGTAWINPDGTFLVWSFGIDSLNGQQQFAYSQTLYSAFYYQDHTPVGDSWVANQFAWGKPMGSWTMSDGDDPVSTPEPSSLLLLGTGLAALGAAVLLQTRVRA